MIVDGLADFGGFGDLGGSVIIHISSKKKGIKRVVKEVVV
jgi:hypothetical protein